MVPTSTHHQPSHVFVHIGIGLVNLGILLCWDVGIFVGKQKQFLAEESGSAPVPDIVICFMRKTVSSSCRRQATASGSDDDINIISDKNKMSR